MNPDAGGLNSRGRTEANLDRGCFGLGVKEREKKQKCDKSPNGTVPITRGLLANVKSDFALRLFRRSHQLSNRFENCINLFVMFPNPLFEFRKFSAELAICLQRFT